MNIAIRPAVPDDAPECGRIVHTAFKGIAEQHGFAPDIPSLEAGVGLATHQIAHPLVFGVVAESEGRIMGSIFLDERDAIRGLGPITVDPGVQQRGIGRQLMQAAIERGKGGTGIRLMQDAFNTASMTLYASLGFDIKEPLVLMAGSPRGMSPAGIETRPLTSADIDECAALCVRVHGVARSNELRDAAVHFKPFVALRGGRITAYVTGVTYWPVNHGVAETEEDMCALLSGAAALTGEPLSFLMPTRQSGFFRWALGQGLRAINPRTLMAMGQYQEPKGCYFPSVVY